MKTKIIILLMLLWPVISYAQNKKVFEFRVEGMTCNGCANTATQALLKMEGVQSASVDFETKNARVVGSATREQIKETIAAKNFEALFEGESLLKPLTEEEKKGLDIIVIKGGNKIKITDYVQAGKITIFDFYADWCGPCRVFSPKVERLLLKYRNKVVLKKVDIVSWKSELSKQLTKEYRMPALPFILIFNDKGKLLGKVEGNYIEQVEQIIKQN